MPRAFKESLPRNVIEAHPPERGERSTQPVILYSCCCCCCCCLHTVGGVIGTAVAANTSNYWADDRDPATIGDPVPRWEYAPSSQWLYWSSVLIAIVLSWIVGTIAKAIDHPIRLWGALPEIGFGLIMIGPAWLLGGSVVMAIRLLISAKLRRDASYWRSLGLITAGNVGGTLAGVLVMYLIYAAMSSAR